MFVRERGANELVCRLLCLLGLACIVVVSEQIAFTQSFTWLILWPLRLRVVTVCCFSVVHLLDSHLEAELYKHDLNGDRSFSGAEVTLRWKRQWVV